MGNYPFVSPRVVERPVLAEASGAGEPLRFETVESEDAFLELGGDWDGLVRAMPRPSPFLLHCWLIEWWRHYGQRCRLAVQTAFRGDRLVAALPLIVHSHRGLRIATFLGARQSALADALVADDESPDVVEALVDRVAASEHDYVDLFGLAADCRLATMREPRALHVFQRIEAPVLDLTEGWEAVYRAKTTSRKRALHRRRRRQLEELGEVEVSQARAGAELEPALEEAFRVHELRWRNRPDGSGFVTPTGKRFHRAVVRALAEIDVARIVSMKLDGRTIAFTWYIVLEQRAYLHRLAFDPAFARCSPGLMNAHNTLEVIAAEGVRRVEFLGGAERYKVELADRFEPLHLGLGLPGSARGQVVVAARARWLRLRELVKRSQAARKIYYGTASVRGRFTRPRDVLLPSGVKRSED
jgi:CelD/BcsL family acetyltransferase involved in cellulose biosynthesis